MSSRIEIAREAIIGSGGPLGVGNYGNRAMKRINEGERRIALSGKELNVARRINRQLSDREEYEKAKQTRVLERVKAVMGGYDDFCYEGFVHEKRYLRIHGIM